MIKIDNDIKNLKLEVLERVAKLAFDGDLDADHLAQIPFEMIPTTRPRFRCCVYKEREILSQRTRMATGKLPTGVEDHGAVISVIPSACEGCPINRYRVTENCQRCLAKKCQEACPFGAISMTGKGAYILSTINNLFRGISQYYRVTLDDSETVEGRQTMICICNGRWYGGSFNPVPDAEPDDGLLDVLIVEKVNLLQVAGVIGKYQKGHYADYPHLIRHVRCHTVRVECEQENVVNVDGEAIRTTDAQIELIPQAIRFFYPRGLTYRCENSQK